MRIPAWLPGWVRILPVMIVFLGVVLLDGLHVVRFEDWERHLGSFLGTGETVTGYLSAALFLCILMAVGYGAFLASMWLEKKARSQVRESGE